MERYKRSRDKEVSFDRDTNAYFFTSDPTRIEYLDSKKLVANFEPSEDKEYLINTMMTQKGFTREEVLTILSNNKTKDDKKHQLLRDILFNKLIGKNTPESEFPEVAQMDLFVKWVLDNELIVAAVDEILYDNELGLAESVDILLKKYVKESDSWMYLLGEFRFGNGPMKTLSPYVIRKGYKGYEMLEGQLGGLMNSEFYKTSFKLGLLSFLSGAKEAIVNGYIFTITPKDWFADAMYPIDIDFDPDGNMLTSYSSLIGWKKKKKKKKPKK